MPQFSGPQKTALCILSAVHLNIRDIDPPGSWWCGRQSV